jgi:PP-loop superfamily ATP-utilizing enzyme
MDSPFDRHAKAILFFSGGKDSLACLHLLREYWDRVLVVWANPGEALPELRAQMDECAPWSRISSNWAATWTPTSRCTACRST